MAALINVFLEDSTIEHTASPFDKNTSAGVVLKELQKAEVGTLKKATGVTVTEESGILPAGAYRFYRAQSGTMAVGFATLCCRPCSVWGL
jgi:hypothetical protein